MNAEAAGRSRRTLRQVQRNDNITRGKAICKN